MFFSNSGEYEPCGMFTIGHISLIIITLILIHIALDKTKNKDKEEVRKIIKKLTIIMWILEIFKICFTISKEGTKNLNTYLPLYYCSLLLYAGLLSSFAEGKLRRTGDVFLATGGIVGGAVFLIMPTTSLPSYPLFHFISIHSFFFHGTMVYLGMLINKTKYIVLEKNDIIYFASLVGIICIIALIINNIFDSNLMFISKNFPETPIELIYDITGPLFTLVMCVGQMTVPYYLIYRIEKSKNNMKINNNHQILKENSN